jgi:hypothetical protein
MTYLQWNAHTDAWRRRRRRQEKRRRRRRRKRRRMRKRWRMRRGMTRRFNFGRVLVLNTPPAKGHCGGEAEHGVQ